MIKVIELKRTVTDSNDRDAANLREELKRRGVFLINLMSAPGSGKTTLLSRTITDLAGKAEIGVMEADIASDVDAARIKALGAESIQVHTDGMCHMDAGMTRAGLDGMEGGSRTVFLENIGNLICPAEFDTGAHKKVMILSVPEGDD
ncbi:MAG: hydrogenase nickel incorporation protein HypB, partial [Clostridia bacterium]|nr:hydrogenase nickel incorporation protein HypB [Clostridia bacterium]